MRLLGLTALSFVLAVGCASERSSAGAPRSAEQSQLTARINPEAGPTLYTNGLWYTGAGDSIEFVAGERYAENGVFVTERPDDAAVVDLGGNAFYDVTTVKQLDEKWARILATEPDFLKPYLLQHDTDESAGLSDAVFREAVSRAKATGLRTTVHLETVQDLALAVDAGATEAGHLPAYDLSIAKDRERSRIPDALIAMMADRGFIVVATTNVSQGREYTDEELAIVTDRQADNLGRMKAAGVPIAVGSDSYFQTAWNEIQSLKALGIFTDDELLVLWVRTPRLSIFPGRAIGALEPGYEASFLALGCDPSSDIACATKIRRRVKNGQHLDAPVDSGG